MVDHHHIRSKGSEPAPGLPSVARRHPNFARVRLLPRARQTCEEQEMLPGLPSEPRPRHMYLHDPQRMMFPGRKRPAKRWYSGLVLEGSWAGIVGIDQAATSSPAIDGPAVIRKLPVLRHGAPTATLAATTSGPWQGFVGRRIRPVGSAVSAPLRGGDVTRAWRRGWMRWS